MSRVRIRLPRPPGEKADELLDLVPTVRPPKPTIKPEVR